MTFHATNNHEEIRTWIESHNGKPTVVRGSTDSLNSLSIVWLDMQQSLGDELEEISWDEFFDVFETGNLSFRYSTHQNKKEKSFSFNFISRDGIPALDNQEFILPEDNEIAKENMFPSSPPTFEPKFNNELQ